MNKTRVLGLSAILAVAAGVAISQTDLSDEASVDDAPTADAAYGVISDDELKVCYPDPDFQAATSGNIIQAFETEVMEAGTVEELESFMTDEEIDGMAEQFDIDPETVRGVAETLGTDSPDASGNLTDMLDAITGDALKADTPVLE